MTDEDRIVTVSVAPFDDVLKIMQEEGCYSRLWSPQDINIWRAEFSWAECIGYAEEVNYNNAIRIAACNYFEMKQELEAKGWKKIPYEKSNIN